jgi:hypothetical protein
MYKLEMQITGGGVITIEAFETSKIIKTMLIFETLDAMDWDIEDKAETPSAPTKRRGRPPGSKKK